MTTAAKLRKHIFLQITLTVDGGQNHDLRIVGCSASSSIALFTSETVLSPLTSFVAGRKNSSSAALSVPSSTILGGDANKFADCNEISSADTSSLYKLSLGENSAAAKVVTWGLFMGDMTSLMIGKDLTGEVNVSFTMSSKSFSAD